MHGSLQNAVKQHAAGVIGTLAKTTLGHVSSFDSNRYAVKVTLTPSGVETGWMPIVAQQIGRGWGAYFAPALGDQCLVGFVEMYPDASYVIGFLSNDSALPPQVNSGEILLQHSTGARIYLAADSSITLNTTGVINIAGLNTVNIQSSDSVNITATGGLNVTADTSITGALSTSGNIIAGSGASGSFTTPLGQVVTVADGIITNII